MGHLMRMLALADMLKTDYFVRFIIETNSTSVINLVKREGFPVQVLPVGQSITDEKIVMPLLVNIDAAIIDFYGLTESYQLAVKGKGFKLICIDDLYSVPFHADLVLNSSNKVSEANYIKDHGTKLLLGSNYALLRPIFLESAVKIARKINAVDSVFINMGGADAPNHSLKFLKSAYLLPSLKFHIVVGALNPHIEKLEAFIVDKKLENKVFIHYNLSSFEIHNLMVNCQLAICPASGISLELCAVGLGMITGFTADNQKDMLSGLVKSECVISLGDFDKLSETQISHSLEMISNDVSSVNKMIAKQRVVIDGMSPERIKKAVEELWMD